MSGINKYSFMRWILGMALVATSGITFAGQVTDPAVSYGAGDTLTASKMNSIRDNINDNDTRITNLQGNVPGTGCVANTTAPADDADGMVRVGPLCIDKFQAQADFAIPGCLADGMTSCGTVKAFSKATGTAAVGMSWAQAQRACLNAGKRLPTPGEWMAGFLAGAFTPEVDKFDFVDAFLTLRNTAPATDPSSGGAASLAQAGYIGIYSPTPDPDKVQLITNVDYNALVASFSTFSWHFRCVR